MKEKISKNTKRYTKNSIVNTKRGDFGEDFWCLAGSKLFLLM
jgi:hypothetical protein